MHRLKWLLAGLLAWSGSGAGIASESITVATWGGAYERAQRIALFDPFTRETGIEIVTQLYIGGGEPLDRVAWDVVDMPENKAITACEEGLLLDIEAKEIAVDYQGVSIFDDFMATAFRDCSVAHTVYSTVFAYDNREFLGEKPKSIADFFDLERFPGKRALQRTPDVILEWALIAEGVPVGQVYDLLSTDRGLRLALRRLETLRGSIVWWSEPNRPAEMLNDAEAVMASGYNGRFFAAVQETAMPIRIVWDAQVVNHDVWGILKSSTQPELAKQFIRFATAPPQMAALAEQIPYGPTRQSAMSRIGLHQTSGAPMLDHLPNASQHVERSLKVDNLWYARTQGIRARRFDAWLKAGRE